MELESLIDSLLDEYHNDLWLKRRLELDEVLQRLEALTGAQQADQDKLLADRIRFIRLLGKECAGLCFNTERQWCELMNLMQISKKLNHRSVKFKDILHNRRIIESNIEQIHNLNEAARIGQTIDGSLNDLENRVQNCHLNLPKGRSSTSSDQDLRSEIIDSQKLLRDKCRHLLQTLQLELESRLISNDSRLPIWRDCVNKSADQIHRIERFTSLMSELEEKVSQLKPLMRRIDATERSLEHSLDSCSHTFKECIDDRNKLIARLYELAKSDMFKVQTRVPSKKSNKVSLYKLTNARNLQDRDMFGSFLENTLAKLKNCQKRLEEIMQNLRLEFGRFYFINDVELLTVISLDSVIVTDFESDDNHRLIRKIFNNSVESFLLDVQRTKLVGVRSPFGEIVHFNASEYVAIQSRASVYQLNIVRILNDVSRKLRRTLKRQLSESLAKHEPDEIDWPLPIQLLLLAEQMRFCTRVESCFDQTESSRELNRVAQFYQTRLDQLSSRVISKDDWLNNYKRSALLSLTVHFVLSLNELMTSNVSSRKDWNWLKQVRYYMLDDGQLEVRIAEVRSPYRFHYLTLPVQGSGEQMSSYKRLIETKITERCFLTASQAVIHLKLGANPYGPAGSGKTESIKALGQLLGCQVIVHNCDESNDCKSLERLVWGLSHSGLWGCFDEFNRLSASVLSSISATLELVQCKLRENVSQVELPDGSQMLVDPDSAFFITFNPVESSKTISDSKYRGRRRLPANLRQLFIPIAMVRVDFESIIRENILKMSAEDPSSSSSWQPNEAFDLAKLLANLISSMKKTIMNSTSVTSTCEWDLRLVMAILNRIKLQLASLQTSQPDSLAKNRINRRLLARAVKLEIEPRLNQSLRAQLLDKLFSLTDTPADCLLDAETLSKSKELEIQLQTHVGVLLLGPTRSGKTISWKELHATRSSSVRWLAINPKAHSHEGLLGRVDAVTMKWSDGQFTKLVRQAHQLLQSDQVEEVWIVLDGSIDPDWIESLNSVLDDNQLLTLASGERLDFCTTAGKKVKLIFETDSIEFASPATISRLGLVYYEPLTTDSKQTHLLSLDKAREALASFQFDQSKLLVLIGDTEINRKLIFQSFHDQNMIIYNCSQLTNAYHLTDMIENIDSEQISCIVIHNIQLIDRDLWGTRNLTEYLRYLLSYTTDDENSLSCNFIVTVDSREQIDSPRTLSISTTMELEPSAGCKSTDKQIIVEDIEHFLSTFESPIAILSSTNLGNDNCKKILESLTVKGNCVFQFSNLNCINVSLEELEKIVNGSNRKDCVFLLNDVEFRLMDQQKRSRLCHSLNKLTWKPKATNFLYLCHEDMTVAELQFWSFFGQMYQLDSDTSVEMRCKTLLDLLRAKQYQHLVDISWFEKKLAKLLSSLDKLQLRNERTMQTFTSLLVDSFHKWLIRLQENQKTLKDSLGRLEAFQTELKVARENITKNRIELQTNEQVMVKLIESLDEAQKEARCRKSDIERLKREQEDKNEVIKVKSSKVEVELARISTAVEQAKKEIAQHLNPEALNEIKSLRSPPKTIKDILDILFVFLGEKDTSWLAVKAYLTKYSLKDKLNNYNFDNINAKLLQQVEKLMKAVSLDPQQAARASAAAVPIVKWIQTSLDYGKALIRLKPIQVEMNNLAEETKQLERSMDKIKLEQIAIDKRIEENSFKLNQLQREQERSSERLKSLESMLDKAGEAHENLQSQFNRWRFQLSSTEQLLSGNKLIGIAMVTSYLAVFNREYKSFTITRWIELMELTTVIADELQLIKMIVELNSDGKQLTTDDSFDLALATGLLILKLNIDGDTELLSFLDLEGSTSVDFGELRIILASYSILLENSDADKQIVFMRHDESAWLDSLHLATRLNKLVVLEINQDPSSRSRVLDVLQVYSDTKDSAKARILLFGSMAHCTEIEHLLRPVRLEYLETPSEIMTKIMQKLNQLLDPDLNQSMVQLSAQIELEQSKFRQDERDLMGQLALKQTSLIGDREVPFDEDLLQTLNRLHEASESSRLNRITMETTQRELRRVSEKYRDVARVASQFYVDHVATLRHVDLFYHCSIDRFISMIAEQVSDNSLNVNFSLIASKLMQSMRPNYRLTYMRRLGESKIHIGAVENVQLTDVIGREMNELRSPKLMIIAHEACQSSPQTDIDELFQFHSHIRYNKIYATGDEEFKQLNDCLRALLAVDSCKEEPTNCLCVINAHLSCTWINRNLVEILKSNTDKKLLVILVGELAPESSNLFDLHVYEFARVKWWYDELSLNPATRFNRYADRLLPSTRLKSSSNHLMAKQLILLHVVCQERVKDGRWAKGGYSFDFEQLRLAMRVLDQMQAKETRVEDANLLFRKHLASTIYDSRMETLEDEQTLSLLIDRCFAIDDLHLVDTVCIESADDSKTIKKKSIDYDWQQAGTDKQIKRRLWRDLVGTDNRQQVVTDGYPEA